MTTNLLPAVESEEANVRLEALVKQLLIVFNPFLVPAVLLRGLRLDTGFRIFAQNADDAAVDFHLDIAARNSALRVVKDDLLILEFGNISQIIN